MIIYIEMTILKLNLNIFRITFQGSKFFSGCKITLKFDKIKKITYNRILFLSFKILKIVTVHN